MFAFLILLLVGAIAYAPLVIDFFGELWSSPNHFFFPFGIAIVGLLAFLHRGRWLLVVMDEKEETAQQHRLHGAGGLAGLGVGISLGLGLVSHAMHWTHLGWCSLLMLGMSVAYRQFGRPGMMAALPLVILLYFLKPVPSALEPWFQLGMQSLASRMASALLDFGRVFHFSSGVVIGLVERDGLADEVCNGVRSIVLVVFAAIAWGVYFQYHWFRTTLNVAQAILWVLLWNAVRIAILLMNQDAGGSWVESPWMVVVVELGCLMAMLFFTWSGDQFFASVREPRPFGLLDGVETVEAQGSMGWWCGANRETLVVCVALGLVALLGFRWWGLHSESELRFAGGAVAPGEMVGGWKRTEAEMALQPRVSPIFLPGYLDGAQHWEFENGASRLQWYVHGSSPNYPGPTWHWAWYGWTAAVTEEVPKDVSLSGSYAVLKLARLPGEAGGVVSCGVDRRGFAVGVGEPIGSLGRVGGGLLAALQYAVGWKSIEAAKREIVQRPIRSVSLYQKSARALSEEAEGELKVVFEGILSRYQDSEAVKGSANAEEPFIPK